MLKLNQFHPIIQSWFINLFHKPTDIQIKSWEKISNGEHVLVSAPTGSGKTLTAFLWAINQLVSGEWENGRTRVLYISPLKALNNDIHRNLLKPLEEIKQYFESENLDYPDINVMTRSGDTDPSDRNRMLRNPPEILIITPESFNLLLSSPRARFILQDIKTVILDEIHATADSKRGTHLITAVERLTLLSGEFQRIALSATIKPLENLAAWIGGYRMERNGSDVKYIPRTVKVIESQQIKQVKIQVQFPALCNQDEDDPAFWKPYVDTVKMSTKQNRSTLIFTNNRRFCERLSYLMNEGEEQPISYSHHGSLSSETREVVEQKLKNGDLSAIVATSSLEMGIDIGDLDEVLMIQPPWQVSSAMQRIGRSGHGVGETSRGTIYAVNGKDLIYGAIISRCVLEKDIEPVNPVVKPLDILMQITVSMVGIEEWNVDELFDFLRTTPPYHQLSRKEFDLVINVLEGKYANNRLRHIKPLLSYDRIDGTVKGKPNALHKIYMMGGTIPDRGYYALRHLDTRVRIGELDEEFVWERSKGDTFMFGSQVWRIMEITNNDVIAKPTSEAPSIIPFWKQEESSQPFHLPERVGKFLAIANRERKNPEFKQILMNEYCLDQPAAESLIEYVKNQRESTKKDLPHRNHVLIEHTQMPGGKKDMRNIVIHTFWGSSVNQPLAMAFAALWEEKDHGKVQTYANNDSIVITVLHDQPIAELLLKIPIGDLDHLLRKKLESSGFFGGLFRQNAGRAMMLPRGRRDVRTPLWLHRLRAKELLDATSKFEDFPVLLETWRECLQDQFNLDALRMLLDEIQSGKIAISEIETASPSPFCANVIWRQSNNYVYILDDPYSTQPSNLRDDLIQEIIKSPGLRPEIPSELNAQLEKRLQRLLPGYAPSSSQDLLDWIKERLLIPIEEWKTLTEIIHNETDEFDNWISDIKDKIVHFNHPNTNQTWVIAAENLSLLKDIIPCDELITKVKQDPISFSEFLRLWLAYYGVVQSSWLQQVFGITKELLTNTVEELTHTEDIVVGLLTEKAVEPEICDRQNFERLLRLKRRQDEPAITPQPPETLQTLLALHQGLIHQDDDTELPDVLEHLLCLSAPAEFWEKEFLPARIKQYKPSGLDGLMTESGLLWLGTGKERISLCFPEQLELIQPPQKSGTEIEKIFTDPKGKYELSKLIEESRLSSAELTNQLWNAVWKGIISNDSMASLRQGISNKFSIQEVQPNQPARRSGFARWKSSRPFAGNWFLLPKPTPPEDQLDATERQKEKVRVLLDRYGILFRDLLARELPSMRWGEVFRALRLMELSGEIAGGYFIDGIMSVQFASMQTIRILQQGVQSDEVYWISAVDPASLCGIQIKGLPYPLPERRAGNHVVFHGNKLVLVSKRAGKELEILMDTNDKHLPNYFEMFETWMSRTAQPMKSVVIEKINDNRAMGSPYIDVLKEIFQVTEDYKQVTLRKRYH